VGRRPGFAYASRVQVLASVGALSAVFAFEMVLGAFAAGTDQRACRPATSEAANAPMDK